MVVISTLFAFTTFLSCRSEKLGYLPPYPGRMVYVGNGFAGSSVNSAIFRQQAICTFKDYQYLSYYDSTGQIVFARQHHDKEDWELFFTRLYGRVRDAHNVISFGFDRAGYIHLCYDMHDDSLIYRQSVRPEDPYEFNGLLPMTSQHESKVTYPQFITAPDSTLYFFYRDGSSGNGDLMLNKFDAESRLWSVVQHPLVSGEGRCNPYWMTPIFDAAGALHLAWCWRDTPDATTNHDICYATTPDGGKNWSTSSGASCQLPITQSIAEVIAAIPKGSGLINQCSMAVDGKNRPHIAYYRNDAKGIPQYFHLWWDKKSWHENQVTRRTFRFDLAGRGTRFLMISRPQIAVDKKDAVYLIFRDEEKGGRIRIAKSQREPYSDWQEFDIYGESMFAWEPNYDLIYWQKKNELHLFYQVEFQLPGDRGYPGQSLSVRPVGVLRWKP